MVKLTPISADSTKHHDSQHLSKNPRTYYFNSCLGFTRQLSQSPGVYCRLEVKLEDKFFVSRLEVLAIFRAKGKVERLQERLEKKKKGCLQLVTMKYIGSVAPGDPYKSTQWNISPSFILSSMQ